MPGNALDPSTVHDAALRAGRAGDLRAFVNLAGGVGRLVLSGAPMPRQARWVLDPAPIVGGEECPPVAVAGPMLVSMWRDEDRRADVARWLAHCLVSAYDGDWGDISKADRGANEQSLKDGSRLLCVYPWLGEPKGSRDLWCWIEAQHIEEGPHANLIRRVSLVHRSDY